jgi:multicomponent Na+:H+ antiporter subunit D
MTSFTIIWIALPLLVGFSIYLLPQADRVLAFGVTLVSLVYAMGVFLQSAPLNLDLLDSFGVTLLVDQLSAFFILTNALVTMAVILYCWRTDKTSFFYTQAIILHGSLNSAFICADFISLYVALEVIGIAAFLLIAYPRQNRTLWVALRYLFISNTAMLFYLMGAILVYQTHQSFAFAGLADTPIEALVLIVVGLLAKGGIFVSGLWLPLTHAESESPVSALLSGVVVKAGVFPLVRCALMMEEFTPMVRLFGLAAALLGVLYALFERDTKRVLACSTLSQLGWILVAPSVAGPYALAHGLGKAALFLGVGNLPSRDLPTLRQNPIDNWLWLPITLASLSISGFPVFLGFSAKMLTLKAVLPWQSWVLNLAAVGTAILYAKFIFLPHRRNLPQALIKNPGLGVALWLLLTTLVVLNLAYLPQTLTWFNVLKALGVIGVGWLVWGQWIQTVQWKVPRGMESFEHLIGGMSVMLVLVFWMAWSWSW